MNNAAEVLPEWLDVSRETQTGLLGLLALVARWNPTINLVSDSSLGQGWTRHILDSAQLWKLADAREGIWLDLGSGGGFPGLVIALIAKEKAPDLQITLVESDRRKCVFLSEAARQLGIKIDLRNCRIDALDPIGARVVSARALAPLGTLLHHAKRHLAASGVTLFPKGQAFEAELNLARGPFSFDCEVIPSQTDPAAVILRIENVENA